MLWDAAPLVLVQAAALAVLAPLGRTSFKAYRLSRAPPLRRFLMGVFALGIAQAAALALSLLTATTYGFETDRLDRFDALFWLYYSALVVFGLSVLSTFDRRKYKWVLALGPVLLVAGPIAQVIVLALLFLIVIHAGLNHIERARIGSLQTAGGYFLLLAAHFVFLFGYRPLGPRNLLGEVIALAGLLLLWIAARGPRRKDA